MTFSVIIRDFMICFIFAQFIIFNFECYLGTKCCMPLFCFLASSGNRQSCDNAYISVCKQTKIQFLINYTLLFRHGFSVSLLTVRVINKT